MVFLFFWNRREFIHPVEVSAFYRSTFQTQDLENTIHKVPSHVYCRIGKVLKYCFHEVLELYNSLYIFTLAFAVGSLCNRAVIGYAPFYAWETGGCWTIFCENLRYSFQLLQGYPFPDYSPLLL